VANLRDRLKRIQEQKKKETRFEESNFFSSEEILAENGWQPCGFKVLKREKKSLLPFKIKNPPKTLKILIPDLIKKDNVKPEDFLFFDLETTGLSGGAGTVAFLAAFGKILLKEKLLVTQYLLLDYPGENDFLDAVLKEISNEKSVIVTYNGKCFDFQILKTRCLLNRKKPPSFYHVDLLHPARRLWKSIIQDCSQSSIETHILGLDRKNDIPGSLAPEIWFEYLKTGKTQRLTGICDHNCADISGLFSILAAMISIADNPYSSCFNYDIEKLALYWRKFKRRNSFNIEFQKNKNDLLCFAAEMGHKKAVYFYAYDLMRKGNYSESLKFVYRGLKLFDEDTVWHKKLLRRKERLEKKLKR
jgi:uncharacterized protein YprB with RNaseH-like and TPR domain